jgi:hypothetical protein
MMPEVCDPLDPCPQCLRERGLCAKHYAGVLPLLSRNIGWLRLIAEALVEQKARQSETALSVSSTQAAHRKRKQSARWSAATRRASRVAAQKARQRSIARLAQSAA